MDNKPRLDSLFSDLFKVTPSELSPGRAKSRSWERSSETFEPGCRLDEVLVLCGPDAGASRPSVKRSCHRNIRAGLAINLICLKMRTDAPRR